MERVRYGPLRSSGPGAGEFLRSVSGPVSGRSPVLRSRARVGPETRFLRSRARVGPETRFLRSRARAGPETRFLRARAGPETRFLRSRARVGPETRCLRSRARVGPETRFPLHHARFILCYERPVKGNPVLRESL